MSEYLDLMAEMAALRTENAALRERLALIESFKPEYMPLPPWSSYHVERPIDRARVDAEFARLRAEIESRESGQSAEYCTALAWAMEAVDAARERLMGGGK